MKVRILFPALFIAAVTAQAADPAMQVEETEETIEIRRGDSPVLTYHKAKVPPPPGKNPAYARSGFIHPLHTPAGGVVTGIHPDDHYHHLGLWHAWVNTEHDGRKIDFWNLAQKTGAVRYAETVSTSEEPERAGFVLKQEHVALDEGGEAKVILSENLEVTARFVDGAYLIDYVFLQENVTDKPLKLAAYRYGGGLAYRAPHSWNKENSDYLTSEGKDRTNSHTTRAKWCAFYGPTKKGDATLAILCSPKNHDFPQRLRTWDDGKIFFNYVPIQEHAWALEPGKTYRMAYRLVVEDADPSKESIDKRWESYAGEEES